MKSIIIQPHDLWCGESWICCWDFHNSEYLYDTFQSHRYVPAALLDKLFLRRYYCTVLFKYIHCILSFMYIKNVWRTRVISKLSLLQEKKNTTLPSLKLPILSIKFLPLFRCFVWPLEIYYGWLPFLFITAKDCLYIPNLLRYLRNKRFRKLVIFLL